jgi:hypothetical protein
MLEWFKSWRRREGLKKVARKMAPSLRRSHGAREYYSPEQVLATAGFAGLGQESLPIAIAMFVQPDQAEVALGQPLDPVLALELKDLRKEHAHEHDSASLSNGGYDGSSDYNPFMHFPDNSLGHSPGQDASGGHAHGGHSCSSHSCGGGGHSCGGGH